MTDSEIHMTQHQTMYDAVTVHAIPHDDTELRAAYIDGQYANRRAMKLRFPRKRIVSIAIDARHSADILDVERGDATPEQAAVWVHDERKVGRKRTVYCNLSTLPHVIDALHSHELDADDVWFWLAHPTGHEHICDSECWNEYGPLAWQPHVIGTQWAWPDHGSPGNYDVSAVVPGWPDKLHQEGTHE